MLQKIGTDVYHDAADHGQLVVQNYLLRKNSVFCVLISWNGFTLNEPHLPQTQQSGHKLCSRINFCGMCINFLVMREKWKKCRKRKAT